MCVLVRACVLSRMKQEKEILQTESVSDKSTQILSKADIARWVHQITRWLLLKVLEKIMKGLIKWIQYCRLLEKAKSITVGVHSRKRLGTTVLWDGRDTYIISGGSIQLFYLSKSTNTTVTYYTAKCTVP